MKAYKKNFYYLSEDTLVIFGPPIDPDEIVGIFDEQEDFLLQKIKEINLSDHFYNFDIKEKELKSFLSKLTKQEAFKGTEVEV